MSRARFARGLVALTVALVMLATLAVSHVRAQPNAADPDAERTLQQVVDALQVLATRRVKAEERPRILAARDALEAIYRSVDDHGHIDAELAGPVWWADMYPTQADTIWAVLAPLAGTGLRPAKADRWALTRSQVSAEGGPRNAATCAAADIFGVSWRALYDWPKAGVAPADEPTAHGFFGVEGSHADYIFWALGLLGIHVDQARKLTRQILEAVPLPLYSASGGASL